MRHIKFHFLSIASLFLCCACTSENDLFSSAEFVKIINVNVSEFTQETTTRTSYIVDNTGFHFSWAEGDALGIYPIGGDQVKFPISCNQNSNSAAFDGGAWALRSTFQYAAYYPFSSSNYKNAQTSLPVNYRSQSQDGNGSTKHLSAYDYLACAASLPDEGGNVNLQMEHLGAFIRLQLTMPQADTFSSIVLTSDNVPFTTTGIFDLTAETPSITAKSTSQSFTINLTNLTTTIAGEVITIYAMMAPADLSTSGIKVTVHGKNKTTYAQVIEGKNIVARYAYNFAIEAFPYGTDEFGESTNWVDNVNNGHEFVDLGLTSGLKWATMNVGSVSPKDYGSFFSWGETTQKEDFSWDTYKWCTYSNKLLKMTKYCTSWSRGEVDNKTTLELSDDAANANWGGNWRMPTHLEWIELKSECEWNWSTINGIEGYKVTGSNGKSIFLPACGYHGEYYLEEPLGYYWTSTLHQESEESARCRFFFENDKDDVRLESRQYQSRCCGLSVRAVCQ